MPKPTKKPEKIRLIPRHEEFCQQMMIVELNGTLAYKNVFKCSQKAAEAGSSRLLRNVKVWERIAQLQKELRDSSGVTKEDVVKGFMNIAFCDIAQIFDENGNLKNIHNIPKDIRRAISGIDVFEEYEGRGKDRELSGYVRKIRLWDKNKALENLGKHLGIFEKDNEQRKPQTVINLS